MLYAYFMDKSTEHHMSQLRTLNGAARELRTSHTVLMRRIADGLLPSWRVSGVVLVRLDQAAHAVAVSAPVDPALTLAAIVEAHPYLHIGGAGLPSGQLGQARAALLAEETTVESVRTWLRGRIGKIKTFSADIDAQALADKIAAQLDIRIPVGCVIVAALQEGYRVQTARQRIAPIPLIAVSARDFYQGDPPQPATPRKWAPGEFLGLS